MKLLMYIIQCGQFISIMMDHVNGSKWYKLFTVLMLLTLSRISKSHTIIHYSKDASQIQKRNGFYLVRFDGIRDPRLVHRPLGANWFDICRHLISPAIRWPEVLWCWTTAGAVEFGRLCSVKPWPTFTTISFTNLLRSKMTKFFKKVWRQ